MKRNTSSVVGFIVVALYKTSNTLYNCCSNENFKAVQQTVGRKSSRGILEVYMTGGSDVFFWVENLHARYFFGSRDLSRIFLGLKKIRVFFWVLSPSEVFVSGFRCDQWIRKIFIRTFFQRRVFRVLVFFWVGNFDARYFFGSKISGLCIFLGCNMKLRQTPPPRHVYFEYPRWGNLPSTTVKFLAASKRMKVLGRAGKGWAMKRAVRSSSDV